MKKYISPLLMLVLATFVMAPSWAQAGSGFYLSSDIGLNIASGIDTTGYSNDRSSVCDEYINPSYRDVYGTPEYTSESVNCTSPNRGATGHWENAFDRATGILAGAAVGYSFGAQNPNGPLGGLRVELEYFYRQSNYDQTSTVHGFDCDPTGNESCQKLRDEINQATDRIDSVTSHNLFANLFYDFANTSRFTPYIGIGGGIGVTDMAYGSVWARNRDADNISTGAGLPNASTIQQNLANTVSVGQATLSDTLAGLQILFGVDYAFTEAMSLGLKGRWVKFSSFDSGINSVAWDPLRSHVPNVRLDGSEPVSGGIKTDDIEFFGISVNMKYHF